MIEELQHRMREEGIEVSQTGAASYYAELREAGVVDFTGWDAEGNPEFVVRYVLQQTQPLSDGSRFKYKPDEQNT